MIARADRQDKEENQDRKENSRCESRRPVGLSRRAAAAMVDPETPDHLVTVPDC